MITLLLEKNIDTTEKKIKILDILNDIIDYMGLSSENLTTLVHILTNPEIDNENIEILLTKTVSSAQLPAVKCFLPVSRHLKQCDNILASLKMQHSFKP